MTFSQHEGQPVRTLLAVLLISATPAHADFRQMPCNGTYEMHFGQPTAQATGLTMPVGQPIDAGASVQMGQCGREMVVTIQGMSVGLYQSALDERTWSGAIDMGDGVARDLTLSIGADRNMRGELVARDANLTITRPIWMLLSTPNETRFEGCSETDTSERLPQRLGTEGLAVANLLAQRGFTPTDGLQMSDYLTVRDGQLDDASVQLRLSRDNQILPSEGAALAQIDPDSAHCVRDSRLIPAETVLEFQVNYAEGDPFVFARTIEIETSRITAQAEGTPTGRDLGSAIADGLDALSPDLGAMSSGVTANQ